MHIWNGLSVHFSIWLPPNSIPSHSRPVQRFSYHSQCPPNRIQGPPSPPYSGSAASQLRNIPHLDPYSKAFPAPSNPLKTISEATQCSFWTPTVLPFISVSPSIYHISSKRPILFPWDPPASRGEGRWMERWKISRVQQDVVSFLKGCCPKRSLS